MSAARRRVLLLTYFFPPIGGAGAQRSAQLARYLPELGYDPVVVTGPGSPDYHWTPVDDAMTAGIPSSVAVHRVPAPEPPRSSGRRERAERWLRLRSEWQRWWLAGALRAAREVGEVDLVHATLAPYETADAALAVAWALGKPLLVDLEDPWALDEMRVYPSGLHRRLELRRMRRTLAAADAVVMNTNEAAARVRRFPELRNTLVAAIPNGYDGADFDGESPPSPNGAFRIVHTGSLHTDFGRWLRRRRLARRLLGGAAPGVDFLTRSHVFLLDAVERVRAANPALGSKVEVHLAGPLTAADEEVAQQSSSVRAHGFLPHDETVRLVRSADLLFLPMHDLPEGRRVSIVPCKTYEYLASGRPILAAVPDGDARDLLAEADGTFLCRPADTGAIAAAVAAELERWSSGTPTRARRDDVVRRHEARAIVRDVAAVYATLH